MPIAALDRFRIVLVSPRNPLNIGAAARAMSNFGFRHLRVVNPYELAFREARSAVGASDILAEAEEFKTIADAIADCALVAGTTALRNRGLQHPLRDLTVAARELRKRAAKERIAILFGSEKRGLSNDDLSYCHSLIRIPTLELHPSMNLGQAVAVCLYELSRVQARDSTSKTQRATSEDTDRVTQLLFDLLKESGYLKPRSDATEREKIRRLVRRLELQPDDALVVMGMLRQIEWKLKNRT